MGFPTGADGGGDSRQRQAVAAKRRQQHGTQPGAAEQRAGRGVVTIVAQHRHPRHELSGQRQHQQWQRHVEGHLPAEFRADPDRHGQPDHQRLALQFAQCHGDAHPHHQHCQYRIARRQPLAQQVGDEHGQHQHRLVLQRDEQAGPETEQNTRQHGGGDRRRQLADDAIEATGHPDQHDNGTADQIGPHCFAHAHARQQADQQRGPGSIPGNHDRYLVAQAEHDPQHATAHGDRPDPG